MKYYFICYGIFLITPLTVWNRFAFTERSLGARARVSSCGCYLHGKDFGSANQHIVFFLPKSVDVSIKIASVGGMSEDARIGGIK